MNLRVQGNIFFTQHEQEKPKKFNIIFHAGETVTSGSLRMRFVITSKQTRRQRGSVDEQLEYWTCNSEASSSSHALTAGWICSRQSRGPILNHACKQPADFPPASWDSYSAFRKHANSEVQKPTNDCVFRCRQSS